MTNKEYELLRNWVMNTTNDDFNKVIAIFNKTKMDAQLLELKAERRALVQAKKAQLESEITELG